MKLSMSRMTSLWALVAALMILWSFSSPAEAARLKDIADIEGVRGNQLIGFGIVVGLNGTGDGNGVDFTTKGMSNMLEKMGIQVSPEDIKVKNVASVIVTAELPAFVRPGTKLNITLSSIGDAKSLQGGTLLFTPLKAADGNTYAVGQGAVTVGGFSVGSGGDSATQNHPTVGVISEGATVERAIPFDLFQSRKVRVVLRRPDFTTMTRVVSGINNTLGRPLALALDAASVEIPLIGDLQRDPIGLVAQIENIDVDQDLGARVVINERTGTIIMGEHVQLSTVALAHGNLNIVIRAENQISQPEPFSQTGETAGVTNTDVTVAEDDAGLSIVGGQVSLGDLVQALNALGATPRDLISIFNALKVAGALHAELVVM